MVKRLKILLASSFLVLSALTFRLYQLQILEGDHYRNLSENNRTRRLATLAPRGRIYDRNGLLLVENRPAFDIGIVLEDVDDVSDSLRSISKLSGVEVSSLQEQLKKEKAKKLPFQPLVLLPDADRDVLAKLKVRGYKIPGLVVETKPVRTYPFGDLFSQIVGYVREVSADELKRLSGRYRAGDLIGKVGLEHVYEAGLRGKDGARLIEVDSLGRGRGIQSETSKTPGQDIRLTLDAKLQKVAAEALGDKKGAVVVMNPKNGELLALVSRPSVDSNFFASFIDSKEWKNLVTDKSKPLENRAIGRLYPPGSTMKLFMAVAALSERIITEHTTFDCKGSFKLGRSRFRCHKRGGHGVVDLRTALAQSCNVYFYEIGQRLGVKKIAKYLSKFGFGKETGLRLPGEAAGFVPSPKWKKKTMNEKWYEGETISLSIGQGFMEATPLQIARATSALVNGGTLPKPKLVFSDEQEPDATKKITGERLSKTHLNKVSKIAESVVSSKKGTGRRAALENIRIGGKTGTAQVVSGSYSGEETEEIKDHALFTSFAPVEDPELVVVVVVENAGEGGGVAAAPIAKKIFEEYFN